MGQNAENLAEKFVSTEYGSFRVDWSNSIQLRWQKNLPLVVSIIKNTQFLHTLKRNIQDSNSAISNLALELRNVLGKSYNNVFDVNSSVTSIEICDSVRNQRLCYQS